MFDKPYVKAGNGVIVTSLFELFSNKSEEFMTCFNKCPNNR